jgi:hypothetical protein
MRPKRPSGAALAPTGFELLTDALDDNVELPPNLTFPHTHDTPSKRLELGCGRPVATHVRLDLRDPILSVCPSGELDATSRPVPAVPKVAITKDRHSLPCKDDIRPSRQPACVQAVAEPESPQRRSEDSLRCRVASRRPSFDVRTPCGARATTGEARRSLHSDAVSHEESAGVMHE